MKPPTLDDLITSAQTIAMEGRSESYDGQLAIADVLINRLLRPKYFKCETLWEVCHKPLQFSCWNNSPDRNLEIVMAMPIGHPMMITAFAAITTALRRFSAEGWLKNTNFSGGADHYHTHAVNPNWADKTKITRVIGSHIFYKLADG